MVPKYLGNLLMLALCFKAFSCNLNGSSDSGSRRPQGSTQPVPSAPVGVGPQSGQSQNLPPTPVSQPPSSPQPPNGPSSDCYKGEPLICQIENLIIQKTNKLRASRAPLAAAPHLSYVARKWSDTQASRSRIGHDGFPRQREQLYTTEFGSSEGIDISAENVAMSSGDEGSAEAIAEMFTDMWWNSPGHRANMLGGYQLLGVGVSRRGSGWYGTQIFGSR